MRPRDASLILALWCGAATVQAQHPASHTHHETDDTAAAAKSAGAKTPTPATHEAAHAHHGAMHQDASGRDTGDRDTEHPEHHGDAPARADHDGHAGHGDAAGHAGHAARAEHPPGSQPEAITADAHGGHGAHPHGATSPETQHGSHGTHHGDATDHQAHSDHATSTRGDLPANAAPRTPIAAVTEADRRAAFPRLRHRHSAHDREIHSYWLADRLEWQDADEPTLAWEGLAWVGGDVTRLWLRSEGEAVDGRVEHAHLDVLAGRSVSPWWDLVAGVRHDAGEGPSRTWAALGVQGLAPYKFEVEATAYVGASGRSMATLAAEYDTLLSGRLVLQWHGEATLHGRDDPSRGIASGLSTVEAGARLRYEISRRFAPYVGLHWERALGGTADLRRDHGEPTGDTRLVAGIRFWF